MDNREELRGRGRWVRGEGGGFRGLVHGMGPTSDIHTWHTCMTWIMSKKKGTRAHKCGPVLCCCSLVFLSSRRLLIEITTLVSSLRFSSAIPLQAISIFASDLSLNFLYQCRLQLLSRTCGIQGGKDGVRVSVQVYHHRRHRWVPGLLLVHHAVWELDKASKIWQKFFSCTFKWKRTESVMV